MVDQLNRKVYQMFFSLIWEPVLCTGKLTSVTSHETYLYLVPNLWTTCLEGGIHNAPPFPYNYAKNVVFDTNLQIKKWTDSLAHIFVLHVSNILRIIFNGQNIKNPSISGFTLNFVGSNNH